ncbi:uncharacterized protein LOC142164637 [Nicotiana tabacum]|uniref:Uncharacterized protein LOC142164637 n=1 Tax=Nicotiana tabacum TaxID=4097 RepID=A0AC58S1Q4_TOBAC
MIWFDINLGTSKGMIVSKDLDLHTCIELLKTHSLFKGCRFIVDISERNFGSTSTFEHVNRENQHDNQNKYQQIMELDMVEFKPITEELLQTFDYIQVEGQTIKGHFEFKVVRSSSTRYSLKCNDDWCGWCVRAFRVKDSTLFKIVKIEKNHDYSVNTMKADQRHETSKLISGYIIDNLRDPRFEVTPAFVMAEMQKLHGLDIGFLYMFYAYGSSITGWNHCRPVIVVDATFLKLKFCDRRQAIAYGIAKVYPESHHGICIYHLEQNLKQRKVKSEVIKLFQSTARVYMCKEFDLYMSDITKVNKNTYDYLMEEPPERWALSCNPRRRYDILTTNIVESMNYVLLEARELPILRMMNFIQAFPVDSWRSRIEEEGITFLVDLNKVTCDCFQFQFDELPYIHAIAVIEKRNIKKSNFCSHWYLKESWLKTYEIQIHPVRHTDSWIVPESVKSQIIKPPDFKVPPGRRQKKNWSLQLPSHQK